MESNDLFWELRGEGRNGRKNGRMERGMDERMDGRMERGIDERMDGRMSEFIQVSCLKVCPTTIMFPQNY